VMPAFTNKIPIEILTNGFQGIGIAGAYSSEALARLLGFWPLYYAHEKALGEISILNLSISNADENIFAYSVLVRTLKAESKNTVDGLEAARKVDRLAWFFYGLGIAGLTAGGAAIGGTNQWIAGAAIGLGLGVGISVTVEIARNRPRITIGPAGIGIK